MKLNKKNTWALIFWPESCEISTISVNTLSEVIKPKQITVGWKGDLPWVNDQGITTLYEAKLLKISRNKHYVDSLTVDTSGKIIKKVWSQPIMEEKMNVKKAKKIKSNNQNKEKEIIDISILNLPKPCSQAKLHKQQDNHSLIEEKEEAINVDLNMQENRSGCFNCVKCVCKNWRSQITPQFVNLFDQVLQSLKEACDDPGIEVKNKVVELYPGSEVFIAEEDLDMSVSQANLKPSSLVRNLLMRILGSEELVNCKTAEGMNQKHKKLKPAIIRYLLHKRNVEMTSVEFNEIVKKKIQQCKKELNKTTSIDEINKEEVNAAFGKKRAMNDNIDVTSKKPKKSEPEQQVEKKIEKKKELPNTKKRQQKKLFSKQQLKNQTEPSIDLAKEQLSEQQPRSQLRNEEQYEQSSQQQLVNQLSEPRTENLQHHQPQYHQQQHHQTQYHQQQYYHPQYYQQQYHPPQYYPQQIHNNTSWSSIDESSATLHQSFHGHSNSLPPNINNQNSQP